MRGSPSRIWPRTIADSSANAASFTTLRVRAAFLPDAERLEDALPDGVDGLRARLLLLDAERLAQSASASSLMRAMSALSFSGAFQSHAGLPATSASSWIAWIAACICSWP
jgi:hypothetical protein